MSGFERLAGRQSRQTPARQIVAGLGLSGGGPSDQDTSFALDVASQAEAEAGTVTNKAMTPQRTAQAITALGGGNVSQGDINTTLGSFSTPLTGGTAFRIMGGLTMPGGQYGFMVGTNAAAGAGNQGWIPGTGSTSMSYEVFGWSSGTYTPGVDVVSGAQRYITASPPFDIGDGHIAGFFYVIVNPSGAIIGHYLADVPPWAYNGATSITASYIDPNTGKKYRRKPRPEISSLANIMATPRVAPRAARHLSRPRLNRGLEDLEEITNDIKNADMESLPHPFVGKIPNGGTVALVDLYDDRLTDLLEMQNEGSDELIIALRAGRLRLNNTALTGRRNPKGLQQHSLAF